MSSLALAQATVLANLVHAPPAQQLISPSHAANAAAGASAASANGSRGGAPSHESGSTNTAVTGLSSSAAHASAFHSSLPISPLTTLRHTADHTDFSALMMDRWLDSYEAERNSFDSVSLFCEIKLKELIEITNSLQMGGSMTNTTPAESFKDGLSGAQHTAAAAAMAPALQMQSSSAAAPSKVRTAVCIDLLDILIASVIHPDRSASVSTSSASSNGDSANAPGASRQALGFLLMKLRDELVKSIYVQPVPAHLLLQYQPFYQKRSSSNQLAHLQQQQQPVPPTAARRKQQGQIGSSTARRPGRHSLEEKAQDEPVSGSLTHRARLLSNPSSSHASAAAAAFHPPSSLRSLLDCAEYFSLIPQGVSRNHSLASQARIVMIPSKLFRLRQIQKRVVAAMTTKWRNLLLAWKFWEWRSITAQSKRDRSFDRGSKWATRVTSRIALLEQKVAFALWKSAIALRKNKQMKNLKFKGITSNRELAAETSRLQEETESIRGEISKLDTSNSHLQYELKMLRAQLEHSQVDLQDTAKHQAQCSELLDALRAPLSFAFQALSAQLESFAGREFSIVTPLISVVVDSEFQSVLEPLAIPASHGVEHWALSIAQGTTKARMAVCAQIVARWLALQLKLGTQVLNGGAGNYSEYLVKNENQQRIAAALARIRQLCSSNPPTSLPSFPVPPPRIKKPMASPGQTGAGAIKSPTMPGGSLLSGRSRVRTMLPPPVAVAEKTPAAAADAEEAADDVSAEVGSPSAPKGSLKRGGAGAGGVKKRLTGVSAAAGKIDDLPAPSAADLAKMRRQAEARSQAIPTGTLSTPQRVFAQLRDSDRPESVLAVSAMLMHADGEIARSLKLTPERRWLDEEKQSVAALKALMDTLRITPEMTVGEMDTSLKTVHAGLESQSSALARARSAQLRLAAVEDEVFAQSVKLLHQQSQRKHRHGERENNMPTDLLDIDLTLYSDLWSTDSSLTSPSPPPSKSEVNELNRLFEEYCRDLYKIFVYYSQSHGSVASAASGLGGANLLAQATQGEPRMGNTEFWRFVRDAKLKLQATALIDQIYTRVSDRSGAAAANAAKDGSIGDSAASAAIAADLASKITTHATDASSSAANLIAASENGLSLSEAEAAAEAARVASLRDLGFKQFGETLVRLSLVKFPQEKSLVKKVKNLLLGHVLPNSSANALKYHKAQLQASIAASQAAAVGGAASPGGAAGVGGLNPITAGGVGIGMAGQVNLSTLEVDAVFRKWSVLLKQIFQIYARLSAHHSTSTGGGGGGGSGGAGGGGAGSGGLNMSMTFNDFLGFAREFELLHKYVTQHDLKQLFSNCMGREGAGGATAASAAAEGSGGGGGGDGGASKADAGTLLGSLTPGAAVASSIAAADKAIKQAIRRQTTMAGGLQSIVGGGGGAGGGEDDDDPASTGAGSNAPSKELSYRQFLELLAAVSHYVIRNPYYSLHDRVEKFIVSALASRKKLPSKVFRSAI